MSHLRLALLLSLSLLLAACGPGGNRDGRTDADSTTVRVIGVAYALGGKGDRSYNDAAVAGVAALRAQGIEVREFEPASLDEYERGVELLSEAGVDLIFGVGFLYDEPVLRIAEAHPDTRYVVLDGSASGPDNVASIKFNAHEGSVLAGAVAGVLSESGEIAFVGGSDIPIINEFLEGFREGATLANPQARVRAYYVGTGAQAFTDPVRGREVATTAISRGADVIYSAAGSSGNGVIEAAEERGIYAIGVDVDQSYLAPGTVVTSMMKNFDVAMLRSLQAATEGAPLQGQVVLGLAERAVSLAPMSDSLEARVTEAVENARQRVLAARAERDTVTVDMP